MASQLALKSRIASTASLSKIFNAQEMIASSHIVKARTVALNAKPYSDAIFDAVLSLAAHTDIEHPIFTAQKGNPNVAVLAITADRGMAGPYSSSIIRETEGLLGRLEDQGKKTHLYIFGRRGVTYYRYRNRQIEHTWEGDSDKPGVGIAAEISQTLLNDYLKPPSEGGVSELYIVFTEFINIVTQKVRILRMLPIELVEANSHGAGAEPEFSMHDRAKDVKPTNAASSTVAQATSSEKPEGDPLSLYSFEPSIEEVLNAILPRYVQSRIHECMLTAAASETASRQNAMHTATENANDLIDDLTRKLNESRQAAITQELNEIISSANALNNDED
jgi:F-type H+-transporting ATPase subunit gamma